MLLTVSLPTRSSSRTGEVGQLFNEFGYVSSKYLNTQFKLYKVSYDP